MARVESLGIHTPVALPYLIRDGILPREPKRELYDWQTYVFDEDRGVIEEEVLATKRCVVWSQGRLIRNIYRFELEDEDVTQAILTRFPNGDSPQTSIHEKHDVVVGGYGKSSSKPRQSLNRLANGRRQEAQSEATTDQATSRALAVFLKTKAHIYFLQGSSHIVDLPFEVERAFPAPRGCILQRKVSLAPALPPTPQVPMAPPNSFLSSQTQPPSSYSQSSTLTRSFRGSQPINPSALSGGSGRLDAFFQDIFGTLGSRAEDDAPSLYSFSDLFLKFGVLSYSIQHLRPRVAGKQQAGLSVEFEALDAAEEVIYVSPTDELDDEHSSHGGSLMLLITVNRDLRAFTLWHTWYVGERSLQDLFTQRAAHNAAKARRRSSFLNANLGTGATTPVVRNRDHTRESIAAPGTLRLPGEPVAGPAATVSSRKPTRQEEEAAMASQMDPDYQPTASQQPARESRRISSLNTDMRASQNAGVSYGGPGGRRNTSFGPQNERKSFGHRKSRGSTPGSVFSRSVGPDDDSMELDSNGDFDDEESIESVVRHIRATFEAAGADNLFGSTAEGFRRELIVRKLHSFPISQESSRAHPTKSFRVTTLMDIVAPPESESRGLNVYIHDQASKELLCLKLLVKQRTLWPELPTSTQVSVPVIVGERNMGKCTDLIRIQDRKLRAILLSGKGLVLSTEDLSICPLPPQAPYRVYNPHDVMSQQAATDKEIGKNRILQLPDSALPLTCPGAGGSFDEVGTEGLQHCRRLILRPQDPYVDTLLVVCQTVLSVPEASLVRKIWCMAYAWLTRHPESVAVTASSIDWVAFVTVVLAFVTRLLDAKARAALNLSRLATGKQKTVESTSLQLHRCQQDAETFARPAWSWMTVQKPSSNPTVSASPSTRVPLDRRKDQLLVVAATLADELARSDSFLRDATLDSALACAVKLMLGLHIFREEQKLCTTSVRRSHHMDVAPLIAQLGCLLGIRSWSFAKGTFYGFEGPSEEETAFIKSAPSISPELRLMDEPVGVFQWFEYALKQRSGERYPSLAVVAGLDLTSVSKILITKATRLTPRINALSNILAETHGLTAPPSTAVELMANHQIDRDMLESLPEAIAAPFREAIARCERQPPTTWPSSLLSLIGREDFVLRPGKNSFASTVSHNYMSATPHDPQVVCQDLDHSPRAAKTSAASRHAVSQLIFNEDRRLVEAVRLTHYSSTQVGECPKEPEWDDMYHFEQQRRIMHFMTLRMMALPAGDGMIHYDCVSPLLTEKYVVSGFTVNVLMQPMGHNLTIDRQWLTEEKCGWAYFHAGVSAGMQISRNVEGIDTSWIAFNKPSELTNRHAGLLLALGLGGHLRSLAKWLAFKYLTPKHTMTSVGLLLGLSASYIGTMDSLITRMLSVHITRMLPPGAAELNVSPITQTAGLMGIGLLYYNTQHRRMSEIMLSEVEDMEIEDPDSGPDTLRDESYRLAAGFALGLINLSKGRHLKGLYGMHLPERLLAMAVGPRPVQAVHVFDRATAGAIVAIVLVYMKSEDTAIARKVDIPTTEEQYYHVRPDMLMLRTMARHIIMWNDIKAQGTESSHGLPGWIRTNLPSCYQNKLESLQNVTSKYPLTISDVPFYNIVTGLAWALGLKYAGTSNTDARDEILAVVDALYMISGDTYFYDARLARASVRRCIDNLTLSAATVMAGTGDLRTFRYLRRLHGRTDPETPYGSHLAVHLALGALFLAGGTQTFGTSDLAVASLIIAFYPLFPTEISDNRVHLQAFRHFWTFAAEARCLVPENIDTNRPIAMPIKITMRDGSPPRLLTAPCLLPELSTIATVQTEDPEYWRVKLDFVGNPAHLAAFRMNQTIYVRKCPASEAHDTMYNATLAVVLNDTHASRAANDLWRSIFRLPAFRDLDNADFELILPPDEHSAVHTDAQGTVIDDVLVVNNAATSNDRNALWSLRMLFAWAERTRDARDGRLRWLGHEFIEMVRAKIEERSRAISAVAEG